MMRTSYGSMIVVGCLVLASAKSTSADAEPQRSSAAAGTVPPLPQRNPLFKPQKSTRALPAKGAPSSAPTLARPLARPLAPSSAPPTDPNVWAKAEVAAAKAQCARILKSINAVAIPQPAVKNGECGDPAPIRLVSVGKNPEVALSPPPLVNCEIAGALHTWLEDDLQPLAKRHLKAPIIKIETMVGYACRNRYGRKGTRLSEHARANALDIRGFVTAGGQSTRLLADWGLTRRDIASRLAEKKARDAETAAELADALAEAKADGAARPSADAPDSSSADNAGAAVPGDGGKIGLTPNKLGGPKPQRVIRKARRVVRGRENGGSATSPQGRFLRSAHKGACRIFGTTLGPEANNAHRNHFHVDMAHRRRSNYCE